MALGLIFLLGVANFALHGALLARRHAMFSQAPWFAQVLSGRLSLVVEFVMLLGCMVMTAAGSEGWIWGYCVYSAANGVAAWMILSRRV